ncbi:MAG: PDZ domain-containing protein [Gemmatimonadota bacterium]
MIRRIAILSLALASAVGAQGTRLLRHPSIRGNTIAFAYAGDLWSTTRDGGTARRITATPEAESEPVLSPDGSMLAFSRSANGNVDVYVVPTSGGEARRLTWHPSTDRVRGWTLDGKRIVFMTTRNNAPSAAYARLWTVSVDGGNEDALPLPRAFDASYSPDGKRLAYQEISQTFIPDWYENSYWRNYRGGRTQPVRIFDFASREMQMLPWNNSNDANPMWVGNSIYFISDRNNRPNLFSYDVQSKQVKQITKHDVDVMNASADGDAIAYEQNGYIHVLDAKSGQSKQLSVNVVGEFPWAQPQFKKVAALIRDAALSPTGVRVAFEARGDIYSVPAEKGDWRALTRSSGANEHSPAWSPDGREVAWLSDSGGTHTLMIGDQLGTTKPKSIALPGNGAAYFTELHWAPTGKQLTVLDNHLTLWLVDPATAKTTRIDSDLFETPGRTIDASWSPDSRWVTYSKSLESHLRAVFAYSIAEGKSYQVTDGLADASSPTFDAGGKYLYFLASTDYGPRTSWLEMSSVDRPVRRAIYVVVLSAADPSPLLPEMGDEGEAPAVPASGAGRARTDTTAIRIDIPNIAQRVLSLPVPAGDYSQLGAGPAGSVLYLDPTGAASPAAGLKLMRMQLRERAPAAMLEGVRAYSVSADHKKLLYQAAGGAPRWGVVTFDRPATVGVGLVNVAALEAWIDPHVEWAEILREAWRTQREFFYDAKMHGADWAAVWAKYSPLLPYVNHRADLTYVTAQMGGELGVGHSYIAGRGDEPSETPVNVGLLGADYRVENGRYRISHIYSGENWNPELRAPLSAPGIRVAEGDYILEVNGRPLASPTNVYSVFEQTAGRQTTLRLNSTPAMEGSRLVTVVPIPNEDALRTRAWVEANRRKVDSLSGGKLAYVWLPNTGAGGYTYFTRYFYAQQDKPGAIIDERYNQGGMVADYIANELERKQMGFFALRNGATWTSPAAGIYGPKVMLVNESAGSGGDALPYMFKQRKTGVIVGTRTWGALVGTLGIPPTIDGGGVTAPSLAFYDMNGKWSVENEGVTPDVEVEYTPAEVIAGRDPQLERAVQEALKQLAQSPVKRVPRPAPIDRVHP